MKTVHLFILIGFGLLFSSHINGQNDQLKNEVKLNIPLSLAGYVEGSYEYILSNTSAIGISLGVAYDEEFYFEYAAIPYYRFYFGKKEAAGFFIEGNGAFYAQETDFFDIGILSESDDTAIGIGLGMAIGVKIFNKNGWVFEAFGGAGRNFSNEDIIDSAYPRLGLNLGKRF